MAKQILFFLAFVCLSSCSSQLAFRGSDVKNLELCLQELQIDVADVKHALNSTQVELQLLDEKVRVQNKASSLSQLSHQLSVVEKKLLEIEKTQEKVLLDLRHFSSYADQTSQTLNQDREKISELQNLIHTQSHRLDEIVALKSTLTSISKAMQGGSKIEVKSGDSLEKIARKHNTTVEELKRLNHLQSDRIIVGQELKIE